jgi:hypothetical protein
MAEQVAFSMKNYKLIISISHATCRFSELAKEKSRHFLDNKASKLDETRVNVPLLYAVLKILHFLSDNIFSREPLHNGKYQVH